MLKLHYKHLCEVFMEKLLLEKEFEKEESKLMFATNIYNFTQLTIVKEFIPNKLNKLIEKQRKDALENYMVLGVFIEEQKGIYSPSEEME